MSPGWRGIGFVLFLVAGMAGAGADDTPPPETWHTYGEAVWERATETGRGVFLYLGADWCERCRHVATDAFEDADAGRALESAFLPVVVDIDRRPDLAARFGREPPAGVFLDGTGAYLHRLDGPFEAAALLEGVDEAAARLSDPPEAPPPILETPDPPDFRVWLDAALESDAPRSRAQPLTALALVLGDGDPDGRARAWLRPLIARRDPAGEGLHYHPPGQGETAKRLDQNALAAWAFIEAYAETGREDYRAAARDLLGYLQNRLWDPAAGGFRAGQPSDSDYFALSEDQRRARAAPSVDVAKYTDGNAAAAIALARAATVLGEPAYREQARDTLRWLRTHRYVPRQGYRHDQGSGSGEGFDGYIGDQAWMAAALWVFHREAHNPEVALALMQLLEDIARRHYHAPAGAARGGFTTQADQVPGAAPVHYDPRANGVLAWVLGQLPDDLAPAWRQAARQAALGRVVLVPWGEPDDVALGVLARDTGPAAAP